ncbi:MAG: hypothetical protein ACX939_11660 [Hyphococcus sp.]
MDHKPVIAGAGLRVGARAIMLAAVASAVVLTGLAAPPQARYLADPELAQLLRAFAALKIAFLAPMIGIAWLRLDASAPAPLAAAYISIVTIAGAALALIAKLAAVGLGSFLFHGALIAFLITAWRDKGFVDSLRPLARRKR